MPWSSTKHGINTRIEIQASLIVQLVKNLPAIQEIPVRSLGWEYLLRKGQATHSSILGFSLWLIWYRILLQCRRPGFDPWVGKIPWRRQKVPTPVFWPAKFHGVYSPWGHKESDMTERLSHSLHLNIQINGIELGIQK